MISGKCLVCKDGFVNHNISIIVKCHKCGKREKSQIICENNHYLCNTCANEEVMAKLFQILPTVTLLNPLDIAEKLISRCGISGNSPHPITTASFLLAVKNSTGMITIDEVIEGINRATQIPGGWCGYYGTCGAAVGLGVAFSVITKATPMSDEERSMANEITAEGLKVVADQGGPRCCISAVRGVLDIGIDLAKEKLNIGFPKRKFNPSACWVSKFQPDCKKDKCSYFKVKEKVIPVIIN